MKTRVETEAVSKLEISYNCKTMMMALCVKGEQSANIHVPCKNAKLFSSGAGS